MSKNLNQIRTLFLYKIEQFKKIEEQFKKNEEQFRLVTDQYLISLTKQAVSTECWQLIACCLPLKDKLKLSMTSKYYNEVVFGVNSHVFVWRDGDNDVEKPPDKMIVEAIDLNMPVKVIRNLMKSKASPNQKCEAGWPILNISTDLGYVEIVHVLLESNADVNARDKIGETALMRAIKFPQIVDILLKAGANVNTQDDDGWTPLMEACSRRLKKSVKVLLDTHADVNIRNRFRKTALYYASRYNATNIIKMLLKHGAVK